MARASRATSSGDAGVTGSRVAVQGRGGLLLVGVRVMPSAARTEIRGVYGERLKVAVTAPPEGGKANARVVQALAEWLGVRVDQVSVQTGHGRRDKVVAFSGMEEEELRDKLDTLLRRTEPTG